MKRRKVWNEKGRSDNYTSDYDGLMMRQLWARMMKVRGFMHAEKIGFFFHCISDEMDALALSIGHQ